MYLSEAKEILQKEYQESLLKMSFDFQKEFIEEKIRHSYQVLGYGNLLLTHEEVFYSLDKDFLQAVVLLHDIGRFHEILEKAKGVHVDHGVYGGEYLSKKQMFNKNECVLPIRHHGHLIERLYEDVDYLSLSERQKETVRDVCFLVRDADKLANFYLLIKNFKKIESIFFVEGSFEKPNNKKITRDVMNSFLAHQSVVHSKVCNFADQSLLFLAWIYDLNFKTSFRFLQKLSISEKLLAHFSKFLDKKDLRVIQKELRVFIDNKCQNL